MPQIQPVGQKQNNGFKELLAADAVGASIALGTDYLLQKSAFKHADRYLPIVREQADILTKAGFDTKEINSFVDFIKAKKVSNSSLFYAGLKGAAVAGLLYIGYDFVRKTAGKNDEDFGTKTTIATGLGAIAGGLANLFFQKSMMNSMKTMRDNVQGFMTAFLPNAITGQISNKNLKMLSSLSDSFRNLSTTIGNGKVIKSSVVHGAVRGGAYIGSAYVLYKGLKALFNRKPKPRIQIVEIPEEMVKQISKNKNHSADEEVIDV